MCTPICMHYCNYNLCITKCCPNCLPCWLYNRIYLTLHILFVHTLHITACVLAITCALARTGVPGCAAVDVSATTDSSLRVTMRPGEQSGLLPVWFRVVVTSGDCHTRSFRTKSNNIIIPPCRQSGAEHNVSVLPCNAAGCNKGCPAYLINHTTSEGTATPCIPNWAKILIMRLIP